MKRVGLMMHTVTKLRYGNTNTFLIRGDKGSILVDTDYAGTLMMFYKCLKADGLTVKDINYVIATHYHPDHIGLVSELIRQGVKLIIADSQAGSVHYSDEIFAREPGLRYKPIDESSAVVISADESICIVGDLEPYEYLAAYDDNEQLKEDWDKVLSYEPGVVYYAHANEKLLR